MSPLSNSPGVLDVFLGRKEERGEVAMPRPALPFGFRVSGLGFRV